MAFSEEEGGEPSDDDGSQPMFLSDEENSEDYVPPDIADSEELPVSDGGGVQAPAENLPSSIEDDDGTKMEKLSLAIQEKKIVMCVGRDGAYHPAKVLAMKENPPGCFKYYVHYTGMDRRNDEWVELKKLKVDFTRSIVDDEAATQRGSSIMTRHQKRKLGRIKGHEELDPESLRDHEELTKIKNISFITLGNHYFETWYYSQFPQEYDDCEELFFCEYCLNFLKRKHRYDRHREKKCRQHYPPGSEIYSSQLLSVFEVNGSSFRVFGENLCYLAKLFLDHKSLYYEVGTFLFYVLYEKDQDGFHIAGYFSKEKFSEEGNNLACILTFPPYQKKGYGSFLIAFSYELSKREGKIGRPERPLSDLGYIAYKKYWTEALLEILSKKRNISIKELSKLSAIAPEDIINTLKDLDLIIYRNREHIISAKLEKIRGHLTSLKKSVLKVEPENLDWAPWTGAGEDMDS